MKKIWNVFLIIASVGNAINVVSLWRGGEMPDWFVWVAALFFCVGVALDAIGELIGVEQ